MALQTSTVLLLLHIVVGAVVVSPMLESADTDVGTNAAGLTDRCRIRRIVHRIEQPGCLTKHLLSFACKGGCESYSQYSDAIGGIERYCNCCQPAGEILRKVMVTCRNRAEGSHLVGRVLRIMIPTGCICRPCAGAERPIVPDVVNPLSR